MTWSVRVRALCLAGAIVGVTGCTPAQPAETLRFSMYPATDLLPVYVMESEGIAARHGFEIVESEPYDGGLTASQALASGDADITYPGIVPLFALAAGGSIPDDISVLGLNNIATPSSPAAALVVGDEITSWTDLSGRQIGMHNLTSINAATFAARAKAEGVTDFEFVIVSLVDMGLAVRDGVVAAAVMEEPWTTQAILRGDGRILAFMQGESPFATIPRSAIAVRSGLLDEPELLRGFLRAHLEAVRFIDEHPDEARALFVEKMGVSAEVAAQMDLMDWAVDARLDVEALQELEDVLWDAGALTTRMDPATFYDASPLESVLAERGG